MTRNIKLNVSKVTKASYRALAAWIIGLALHTDLDAQPEDSTSSARSSAEQSQQTDDLVRPRYSQQLSKELARLSCFDTPVGGKMGGVVPLGVASEAEKTALRGNWEKVLASARYPADESAIEWRSILWAFVQWGEPQARGKNPTPPSTDQTAAKWSVGGSPCVVEGATYSDEVSSITVSVQLTGDNRVRFRWPRLEEFGGQPPPLVVVTDIDKARLLNVLTTTFRFPWTVVNDFEVTWSPSPTCAGHLKVLSAKRRQSQEPKQWFDEVDLRMEGDDPQRLSITVVFLSGPEEHD